MLLHGRSRRKLLNAVDMSHKHFKDQFFKVKSTRIELTFFLNDRGEKRYPSYWNNDPSSIGLTKYENLLFGDRCLVDVPDTLLGFSECKKLI